jgi:protein-arginine kinase activator protein McsA
MLIKCDSCLQRWAEIQHEEDGQVQFYLCRSCADVSDAQERPHRSHRNPAA